MAKTGDYDIPFDKDGNQLDYPGWNDPTWVANHEFTDTLTYVSYGRGRSSVTFEFAREDGRTVSMFVTDLDSVLPIMANGKLTGRFTFTKRGQNYGVRMIIE